MGKVPFDIIKLLSKDVFQENGKNMNKIKEDKIVIDYTSDDEFEEIDININNLEDLINLCKKSTFIIDKSNTKNNKNIGKDNQKENIDKKIVNDIIHENKLELPNVLDINNIEVIDIKNVDNELNKDEVTKKKNIVSHYELDGKKYSINLRILKKILKPLNKLNKMVGLINLKNSIAEQIIYYIQNLEIENNNMLHTIIEGPPGVGKTEVGKILAELFCAMEIIPTDNFKIVKRTDLIGEYLGHTAHKTQNVINEANGGVLFIDEAYSLGNEGKKDTYSKECIDVLNQNLSENKKNIICIIAGYPDQLEKCFFQELI